MAVKALKEEGNYYMDGHIEVKLKVANAQEWMGFEKQEKAKLFFNLYLEPVVTVPSTGM